MATGGSSKRALEIELKSLAKEPVEGFSVQLADDSDMYKWDIRIFGPPDTLYAGGYFKARMNFPRDYPYSPPQLQFLTPMFHPNIYPGGNVCISILHAPGHDETSGELASERWNPTQSVRTILLSVVSLLMEPNISSPANVDASVQFRLWQKKESDSYERKIREQVVATAEDAKRDGVTVPTTTEEYCRPSVKVQEPSMEEDMDMFAYDDDDNDDDEEEDGDFGYEEDDDDVDYGDDLYGAHDDDDKVDDTDSGMN